MTLSKPVASKCLIGMKNDVPFTTVVFFMFSHGKRARYPFMLSELQVEVPVGYWSSLRLRKRFKKSTMKCLAQSEDLQGWGCL